MDDPDVLRKIGRGEISYPDELGRYKYILELLIIIIVIYIIWPKALQPHLEQIRWKALIVYMVIIFILFQVMMNKNLTDNQWSTCHAIFYFGLSYCVPNNLSLIVCIEILWELFEDYQGFSRNKPTYIETDRKKMVDIAANTSGYLLGNFVFNRNRD